MLASSVRAIIAPILRACPQECGMVSITKVELASDLSYVTVYVSALSEVKRAVTFLEGRRKELQKHLGALETHKTPLLRFREDRTAQDGNRIDELLRRASKNTSEESSGTSQ